MKDFKENLANLEDVFKKALAEAGKNYKESEEYKRLKHQVEQAEMALDILEGRYKRV